MDAPASLEFALDARVVKVDSSLGLILGWAVTCKQDGQDVYDLQGDHIPEDAMLEASLGFAKSARSAKAMHAGEPVGTVLYMWPMTTEIAKAFGIETATTGLMVAMLPDEETRKGFEDGTYTGFSIGGKRVVDEVVLEKYSDDQERDDHGRFGSGGGGGGGSAGAGHVSTAQGSSETTQVREKAIGVVREGDTYHFVDGSGATVASAQGHAGLQAMLSATGLKGIDQEVRDLRPGQSYHYKRDFGAGVFNESGKLIQKYSDDQERDDNGRFAGAGAGTQGGTIRDFYAGDTKTPASPAEQQMFTSAHDNLRGLRDEIGREASSPKPNMDRIRSMHERAANIHGTIGHMLRSVPKISDHFMAREKAAGYL